MWQNDGRWIIVVLCLLWGMGLSLVKASPQVYKWDKGGIRIALKECLEIPEMSWPVTLLHYRVDLSEARVSDPNKLSLLGEDGRAIPFQLTDIRAEKGVIREATLCFLSDLEPGEVKEFHLLPKAAKEREAYLPALEPVSVTSTDTSVYISNGLIRLGINKIWGDGRQVLLKLGTMKEWLGELRLPKEAILSGFEIEKKAEGDVFAEYQLHLFFDRTRRYDLTVRLIAGMDYVEMDERMSGFEPSAQLAAILDWYRFHPEIRYCPTRAERIDKAGKGYGNFRWEPMEGLEPSANADRHPMADFDQRNGEDGKLPFRLSSYHNWMTWWRLHTAAFWSETTGQSVGIYIHDFEKWKDPSYPLWGSKEYLSVEYYYQKDRFYWRFPLVNGERSVSIALYPHQKDKDLVNQTDKSLVYIDYLRRWYGWISLDKTKDWILDYDSDRSEHRPFYRLAERELKADPEGVLQRFRRNVRAMATANERLSEPTPVGAREYLDYLTPLFEISENQLSAADYKKTRAYYLFMNYVFMDEALMPIRTLLSGHPNFLADLKSIPGAVAFLFPDHPEAREFADHFEKSIALNLRFHVRPFVKSWGAKGGRSTENLSCYTWAFLRPTLKTSFLLHHYYDGKNRMLQPNFSAYCDWLLNTLTAPLDQLDGRRAIPPQGAHARRPDIPDLLNTLGQELRYYDPLLAEHIFWETRPDDPSFESRKPADIWAVASRSERPYERGTNPRLRSAKYTGYGYVLRRNYGDPDEMYVNLQQIDDGPNYRWGRAGKGGNGVIYYYADGKRYSHNGTEDVGDGPFGDTERCTNFGVKKEGVYRGIGEYRSVGRNDLTEPLFDFGFAQFASIQGNEEVLPLYWSRSVLMADNDYIVILDDVADASVDGRFSWFVGSQDNFPEIYQLKPGAAGVKANVRLGSSPYHKDKEEPETKGLYFDGKGDFLTLVTHRKDLKVKFRSDVCRVDHPSGTKDWIFRKDRPFVYAEDGIGFEGKAGFIRRNGRRHYQAALFEGTRLSVPGISIRFAEGSRRNGLSLEMKEGVYSGKIQVTIPTWIRIESDKRLDADYQFYLDGLATVPREKDDQGYLLRLDAGTYDWQLTDRGLIPGRPIIRRCVSGADGCEFTWNSVPGATCYAVWKSLDAGETWQLYRENLLDTVCRMENQGADTKIHLRVSACATGGMGEPSPDYPVYFSPDKAHEPEGLRVELDGYVATLSWGQVLGVDHYTVYSREKGSEPFKPVYTGEDPTCRLQLASDRVYEFAVTATNGNGESSKSVIVDTDRSRFINWSPVPEEGFRRDPESQENGYIEYNPWMEDRMRILTYPE